MREIVLDTETTGINPHDGHRIIEIGALELMHHLPTGRNLHMYINPERDIDEGAMAVHGITLDFLANKPVFADVVEEFLAFIGTDPLVIHNASFDMAFINAELTRVDRPVLAMGQSIDTLEMARKKFPGAQANLDSLCRRFEIDNTHRNFHGALLDADLLASVYIELLGGRQPGLLLDADPNSVNKMSKDNVGEEPCFHIDAQKARPVRAHAPTDDELAAHREFVLRLKDPFWDQ